MQPVQRADGSDTPSASSGWPCWEDLIAGVTVNAVAGFGEELGWRGFLQKELAFLGFWRSSLLIGFGLGFLARRP